MLQGSPWLLAHRSMLKPNRPKKVSLYGQDYVLWQDQKGEIRALPNACPHMGAMLSEGWCVAKFDGSSTIACPFHALEFDQTGSTVLPGSNKATKSLLKPLELIIQGDLIWSYGGVEPKIPIPNVLNEFAAEYEFAGVAGECSVKADLLSMLLNMHDYNHQMEHIDLYLRLNGLTLSSSLIKVYILMRTMTCQERIPSGRTFSKILRYSECQKSFRHI